MDTSDTKKLVASGYDQIVEAYLRQFGHSAVRDRKFNELVHGLPPHARVLDLGCGQGLPVARDLVTRDFKVTGVDGSNRQIELARRNVPEANFIHADMATVEFPRCSFEAVSAFYSITHVPRDEHAALLKNIAAWLVPGGMFLASFGATALDNWTGQWLRTTMFFSHHDAAVTKQLVHDAGLVLERAEIIRQDNEPDNANVEFLWITAQKPF